MRAKKGQILVFVLALMAIGLIIISPLLHYLDTSYNLYSSNQEKSNAYYAADALMEEIIRDLCTGTDVYNSYLTGEYDGWLNASVVESKLGILGFTVDLTIDDSVAVPMPSDGKIDYIYLDPGVEFGLDGLADGAEYDFEIYLMGGIAVEVNWVFGETDNKFWKIHCGTKYCSYHPSGQMWIEKKGGGVVAGPVSAGTTSTAATANLAYSVPDGESGDYIITFKNDGSTRTPDIDLLCRCKSEVPYAITAAAFNGAGEAAYTWVKLGKDDGGGISMYQDYTVTATASRNGELVLSITACIRQTPGPIMGWLGQTINIASWQTEYY